MFTSVSAPHSGSLLEKNDNSDVSRGIEIARKLNQLRIGYVPLSGGNHHPGDRRRFYHYAARRGVQFETVQPGREYDFVILTQAADLSHWSNYSNQRTRLIYDLVDSYLTLSPFDTKALFRGVAKYLAGQSERLQINYWKAIRQMCRRSVAVICTTPEQQDSIREYCPNVHVILDVHSNVTRNIKTDYSTGAVFNLVWEGLPQNVRCFEDLAPVLKRIQSKREIALHLVTDLEFGQYMGKYGKRRTQEIIRDIFPASYVYQWNEQTCSAIITQCDLAVIPIPLEDRLAYGKPENKLALFWRMGMPTLTSATPAYERAMKGAGLMMTCRTPEQWAEKLERYMNGDSDRENAGKAGQVYVQRTANEDVILSHWDQLWESVL